MLYPVDVPQHKFMSIFFITHCLHFIIGKVVSNDLAVCFTFSLYQDHDRFSCPFQPLLTLYPYHSYPCHHHNHYDHCCCHQQSYFHHYHCHCYCYNCDCSAAASVISTVITTLVIVIAKNCSVSWLTFLVVSLDVIHWHHMKWIFTLRVYSWYCWFLLFCFMSSLLYMLLCLYEHPKNTIVCSFIHWSSYMSIKIQEMLDPGQTYTYIMNCLLQDWNSLPR